MNQWAFVIAAYAVAILGTAALLMWAFVAMRRAENNAEQLKHPHPYASPEGEGK